MRPQKKDSKKSVKKVPDNPWWIWFTRDYEYLFDWIFWILFLWFQHREKNTIIPQFTSTEKPRQIPRDLSKYPPHIGSLSNTPPEWVLFARHTFVAVLPRFYNTAHTHSTHTHTRTPQHTHTPHVTHTTRHSTQSRAPKPQSTNGAGTSNVFALPTMPK